MTMLVLAAGSGEGKLPSSWLDGHYAVQMKARVSSRRDAI